jgi:osmoprotectant transport system substrate-binding protein
MVNRRTAGAIVLTAIVVMSGCSSNPDTRARPSALGDNAITVGSFEFAESELLAELYSQALEARGFKVQRAFNLGPREFVEPALASGLIEFLPEYAGTALQFARLDANASELSIADTSSALERALEQRDLTPLEPSSAQNANTFVVTRDTARRYGLSDVSDLAAVASSLTFGGPPECEARRLCLRGLQDVYDAVFKEFVPLDAAGPLTHAALEDGAIDVALLFTTDPALSSSELVALADDRDLQPAENIIPLVRQSVLARGGNALAEAVDNVSRQLTTEELRELNAAIANDPQSVPAVASRWLESAGLR